MKIVAVILTVALVWACVAPAVASSPGAETPSRGDIPSRSGVVSPDVIGIITVVAAYAILWTVFAIALKLRRLLSRGNRSGYVETGSPVPA
jgi:hypothetical protein